MTEPDQAQVAAARPLVIPEIVSLPEELDIANGLAVGDELIAALRPGVQVLIADMSATKYCDSTAMRQLIIASKHAVCVGAEFRVVVSSPIVRHLMHVTGADRMLRMYPDMTAALS